MKKSAEELFESPYVVVDLLPRQVPADGPGRYFAVERYYLEEPRIAQVKQKHADLILKLYCYRDMVLEGGPRNPEPEALAEAVKTERALILTGGSMIVSGPDDLTLTVYAPDAELVGLLESLCAGEGLYVWAPPGQDAGKDA